MSNIDVNRIAFATREYRTTQPIQDPAVLANHPLAQEFEFLSLVRNESDAVAFGQKFLGLRRKDRYTWSCFVNKAYYPNLEIGQTITVQYPRFGFDNGADFIIKKIRTDSNALFDELTLFGPKGVSYEGYAIALDFKNTEYWRNDIPSPALSAYSGYSYTRTGNIGHIKPNDTVLGPDLLTNGDFLKDPANNWSNLTGVTWDGAGKVFLNSAAGGPQPAHGPILGVKAGKRYRLTVKVDTYTGPSGWYVGSNALPSGWLIFNYGITGVFTCDFVSTIDSPDLTLHVSNWTGASSATYDYVRVQEILTDYVLGPELIANGGPGFTATTGWTGSSADLTVENGKLKITKNAVAGIAYAYIAVPTVVGRTYQFRGRGDPSDGYTHWTVTGSGVTIADFGNTGAVGTGLAEASTIFVANNTTTFITMSTGQSTVGKFAYVLFASVREVITDPADRFLSNEPEIIKGKGYFSHNTITNAILHSNDFTQSPPWSQNGVTITADALTSSDGSIVLDKISENASFIPHSLFQNFTCPQYSVWSVVLKAAERRYAYIRVYNAASDNLMVLLDLEQGRVISVTDNSATFSISDYFVVPLGGGLFRLMMQISRTAAGGAYFAINLSDSATPTYDGNGDYTYTGTAGSGIFAGEVQVMSTGDVEWMQDSKVHNPLINSGASAGAVSVTNLGFTGNPFLTDQDFIFWAVAQLPIPSGSFNDVLAALGYNGSSGVALLREANGNLTVYIPGLPNFVAAAGIATTPGRFAVLYRRKAGKDSAFAKNRDNLITNTAESTNTFTTMSSNIYVGYDGTGNQINGWVEGVFARKGTFSDADVLAILGAA